jgi:hypothetical protein
MNASKITGTGTFIPSLTKENADFLEDKFLNNDGSTIQAASLDSTTIVGDLPATGSTKTFSVELRDGLVNGTIVDTDSVTISGISEGSTVYTAQLSNPASSVTVEVDGTTFLENTSTLIRAYKGGSDIMSNGPRYKGSCNLKQF